MFEATLIETLKQASRRRTGLALLVALAAHLAVLAGVFVARLWAVEELEEPAMLVSFWLPAQPPPPPPAPPPPRKGSAQPKPEVPKEEPKPAEVVQPQVVPTAVPDTASAPGGEEGGVEGGVDGGVKGGVEGGVPGGELGGVPGGVPGGLPGAAMRAGLGGIKEPRRVVYVRPVYPEPARKARTQGTVILDLTIEDDGSVGDVRVLMPLSNGLTDAAIEAVKQWKYEPTTLDGQPIKVAMTVTVRFSLI